MDVHCGTWFNFDLFLLNKSEKPKTMFSSSCHTAIAVTPLQISIHVSHETSKQAAVKPLAVIPL